MCSLLGAESTSITLAAQEIFNFPPPLIIFFVRNPEAVSDEETAGGVTCLEVDKVLKRIESDLHEVDASHIVGSSVPGASVPLSFGRAIDLYHAGSAALHIFILLVDKKSSSGKIKRATQLAKEWRDDLLRTGGTNANYHIFLVHQDLVDAGLIDESRTSTTSSVSGFLSRLGYQRTPAEEAMVNVQDYLDDLRKIKFPQNNVSIFHPATYRTRILDSLKEGYQEKAAQLKSLRHQCHASRSAPGWCLQEFWRKGYDLAIHHLQFGALHEAISCFTSMFTEYYNNSDDFGFVSDVNVLRDLGQVDNLLDPRRSKSARLSQYPTSLSDTAEIVDALTFIVGSEMTCSLLLGNREGALARFASLMEVAKEKFCEARPMGVTLETPFVDNVPSAVVEGRDDKGPVPRYLQHYFVMRCCFSALDLCTGANIALQVGSFVQRSFASGDKTGSSLNNLDSTMKTESMPNDSVPFAYSVQSLEDPLLDPSKGYTAREVQQYCVSVGDLCIMARDHLISLGRHCGLFVAPSGGKNIVDWILRDQQRDATNKIIRPQHKRTLTADQSSLRKWLQLDCLQSQSHFDATFLGISQVGASAFLRGKRSRQQHALRCDEALALLHIDTPRGLELLRTTIIPYYRRSGWLPLQHHSKSLFLLGVVRLWNDNKASITSVSWLQEALGYALDLTMSSFIEGCDAAVCLDEGVLDAVKARIETSTGAALNETLLRLQVARAVADTHLVLNPTVPWDSFTRKIFGSLPLLDGSAQAVVLNSQYVPKKVRIAVNNALCQLLEANNHDDSELNQANAEQTQAACRDVVKESTLQQQSWWMLFSHVEDCTYRRLYEQSSGRGKDLMLEALSLEEVLHGKTSETAHLLDGVSRSGNTLLANKAEESQSLLSLHSEHISISCVSARANPSFARSVCTEGVPSLSSVMHIIGAQSHNAHSRFGLSKKRSMRTVPLQPTSPLPQKTSSSHRHLPSLPHIRHSPVRALIDERLFIVMMVSSHADITEVIPREVLQKYHQARPPRCDDDDDDDDVFVNLRRGAVRLVAAVTIHSKKRWMNQQESIHVIELTNIPVQYDHDSKALFAVASFAPCHAGVYKVVEFSLTLGCVQLQHNFAPPVMDSTSGKSDDALTLVEVPEPDAGLDFTVKPLKECHCFGDSTQYLNIAVRIREPIKATKQSDGGDCGSASPAVGAPLPDPSRYPQPVRAADASCYFESVDSLALEGMLDANVTPQAFGRTVGLSMNMNNSVNSLNGPVPCAAVAMCDTVGQLTIGKITKRGRACTATMNLGRSRIGSIPRSRSPMEGSVIRCGRTLRDGEAGGDDERLDGTVSDAGVINNSFGLVDFGLSIRQGVSDASGTHQNQTVAQPRGMSPLTSEPHHITGTALTVLIPKWVDTANSAVVEDVKSVAAIARRPNNATKEHGMSPCAFTVIPREIGEKLSRIPPASTTLPGVHVITEGSSDSRSGFTIFSVKVPRRQTSQTANCSEVDVVDDNRSQENRNVLLSASTISLEIPLLPSFLPSSDSSIGASGVPVAFSCSRGREVSIKSAKLNFTFRTALDVVEYHFTPFQGKVFALVTIENKLVQTALWIRHAVLEILPDDDGVQAFFVAKVSAANSNASTAPLQPQARVSFFFELQPSTSFHSTKEVCHHFSRMWIAYSSWQSFDQDQLFLMTRETDDGGVQKESTASFSATMEALQQVYEIGKCNLYCGETTTFTSRHLSTFHAMVLVEDLEEADEDEQAGDDEDTVNNNVWEGGQASVMDVSRDDGSGEATPLCESAVDRQMAGRQSRRHDSAFHLLQRRHSAHHLPSEHHLPVNTISSEISTKAFEIGEPIHFRVVLQPQAHNWPKCVNQVEDRFLISVIVKDSEWYLLGRGREVRTLSPNREHHCCFTAIPIVTADHQANHDAGSRIYESGHLLVSLPSISIHQVVTTSEGLIRVGEPVAVDVVQCRSQLRVRSSRRK